MPGVPRGLAEHRLRVDSSAKPVKEHLRRSAVQKRKAIGEEVARLLAAGFIREIYHSEWLANVVMVPKKDKSLRMCIDFKHINRACPKDHFPLPRIDQIVDSTAGCERLSFLDAYSGYHQIRLYGPDEVKTAFITPFGCFCYITMPFGLKNAGATFMRMIQKCLLTQISRNVEAYMDDIVVKSRKGSDLLADLAETFANLRRYDIKLNPSKCTFGVPGGKLLGFLVSERGIDANPEKIGTILRMKRPVRVHDVQKLTGCLAALSRFISRLGEKALPLYRLMKKADKFEWTPEADAAFAELKALLSTQPVLAAPISKEPLLLYIAATGQVVSTVLTVEREEEGKALKVQRPVYYLSEVLTPSKQRYPHYQKLVYGIYMTTKKVSHYFSDHSIIVVSDAPLSEILHNRDATGRVAKWAIELLPLDIKFEAKKAIKSQAIADFLAEWIEQQQPTEVHSEHWTMFFDGSKMLNGSGAGVVLVSPRGDKLRYVLQIHFDSSNNEAEYEALLYGLRMAISLGVRRLMVYGDSDLVVNQVMKEWDVRSPAMTGYCSAVRKLEKKFEGLELHHIPRLKNQAADDLAKIGSKREAIPSGVFLEHIHTPSVKEDPFTEETPQPKSATDPTEVEVPAVVDLIMEVLVVIPDWTVPYVAYILRKELPEDEEEARQIVRRSKAFTVIKGQLYRESATGVGQKCITLEEGRIILNDIHSGTCGHHASSRTIVAKAYRAGFYWPKANEMAKEIVDKCEGCQFYSNMSHKPASALKTIPLVWPFAVWGLDMVGPLRTGRSGFTHVLVAVDKFTKWIEAKPIKSLDTGTAVSFIRELIFRYGVPHSIITDNGSNFDSEEFRDFCNSQGTRVDYASVAHPQTNGQAERVNGLILKGVKPRLMRDLKHAAGAWVDELPSVLWGLRTTPNRSTGRTPFFLVYGAEAVLPSDLLHNAPRVEIYNEAEAEQARQDAVDLLEEEREMALIRSTIYQQDLRRFHARNVRGRAFQEGDLVLRVDQHKPHKLAPSWEGPFIVTKVLHNGAYRLYNVEHNIDEPRAWNAELLRPFYT